MSTLHQWLNRVGSRGLMSTLIGVALLLGSIGGTKAAGLVIGEHAALPGSTVRIPVRLSDASGVAAAAVVVNFDPALVALTNVTLGGLGESFAMEQCVEEGRVCLALVRDEALAGGAGTLVYLHFKVNAGAVPGMTGQFAIADRGVSGQHAVNFSWAGGALSQSNGVLRVVSLAQDTDGDAMPDWWEETFFEDPTGAAPTGDDDGDGQTNAAEFRAGTSPTNPTEFLRITSVEGGPPFVVEFLTVLGKTYRIEYSGDLDDWFPLATGVPGTGGLVQVPDGGASGETQRFYRIEVE